MIYRGPNTQHGRGSAAAPSSVPSWRSAMTANTWGIVPVAAPLSSLDPALDPAVNPNFPASPEWNGSGGQATIVTAWCGGCFDRATDTFWMAISGGHSDYAGNEPYKLMLNMESPTWTRLRSPSGAIGNLLTTNDGNEALGVYADGQPRSTHTYNRAIYIPGAGPAMAVLGGNSWSGAAGPLAFLQVDQVSGLGTLKAVNSASSNQFGSAACYDSNRHGVWFRGSATNRFTFYDVALDTWTTSGTSAEALSGYSSMAYLPADDCILYGHSDATNLPMHWGVWDCATHTFYRPTVTGTPIISSGYSNMNWVPSLGVALAWDNTTETTLVSRLTKPANPRTGTWVIDTIPVSGSNDVTPTARTTNGTYGRCQYSENLNGLMVFNSTSGPVYFFALD